MKKKIIFFTGSMALGGIERLVRDLALDLKKTGEWEPSVCCLIGKTGDFLSDLQDAGVPVYECILNRRRLVSFPFRLAHLLRKIKPDIVHSHVDFSIPWQVLGSRLGGVKKIVWTQHSEYQNWNKSKIARFRIWLYLQISWPIISAYTAVSQGAQKSIAVFSGRNPSDFRVINNPVDTSVFKPDLRNRDTTRKFFGLAENQFVMGTVARLDSVKGHEVLIQAAKKIVSEIPGSHFVFIGDGPLRSTLEERVKLCGLEDHITFLGWKRNINEILPGFDLFVLPSLREGLPLSIIEAMACGLLVVASNVGGVPEVLGDVGILVPPGDPDALAEAVIEIYSQSEKRPSFKDDARKRVIERFSLEKILLEYIHLYEEI